MKEKNTCTEDQAIILTMTDMDCWLLTGGLMLASAVTIPYPETTHIQRNWEK